MTTCEKQDSYCCADERRVPASSGLSSSTCSHRDCKAEAEDVAPGLPFPFSSAASGRPPSVPAAACPLLLPPLLLPLLLLLTPFNDAVLP